MSYCDRPAASRYPGISNRMVHIPIKSGPSLRAMTMPVSKVAKKRIASRWNREKNLFVSFMDLTKTLYLNQYRLLVARMLPPALRREGQSSLASSSLLHSSDQQSGKKYFWEMQAYGDWDRTLKEPQHPRIKNSFK